MARRFQCPGCGMSYPFNDKLAGKRVKCKKCANVFTAPSSPNAAPPDMPSVDDLTSNNSLDDLLGESLPPVEDAALLTPARKSPVSPLSGASAARPRNAGSSKMTENDSKALYTGISMFVVGILLMFGIRLRGRGGRIRDRLTGTGRAPVSPTFQLVGLFVAVAGVGVTCFALRRKLHIACPVGAGMLIVLGALYAYSPLNRSGAPTASQLAAPKPSLAPPRSAPAAPAAPGIATETEPRDNVTPPVSNELLQLADQAAVIDLLQIFSPQRDAVAGEWTMNRAAIESTGGRSVLSFPVKPSRNYRWTIVLERLKGKGGINLVIPVDNHQTMVVLEGFGENQASGLNYVSGRSADRNETTRRGPIFHTGTPTTVVCTVHGLTISVSCDGEEIINWSGSPESLSLDRRYWANVPPEQLAVTIWESNVLWRVSESRLERLGEDAVGNGADP